MAAVDLGSNSFHMLVANTVDGHFKVVDRMREMVRLAAGLDHQNRISDEAVERALACLERFGERIRDMPRGSVRVVGTNTLRRARNTDGFLKEAEAALGHPIDIISGGEEARLIYLGVSHGLEDDSDERLVIDIGGGSTEFILGRRFEPQLMVSLHMGCVGMSSDHFPDGVINAGRMRAAEISARQELGPITEHFKHAGRKSAIGASGTNLAVRDVVTQQQWSKDGITRGSLDILRANLIAAGHVDNISLNGLSAERKPVFPAGVAILIGIFEELDIDYMRVSDSALREGLLYDLLGRIHQEDVRDQTVDRLIDRYHIDQAQSRRVSATALEFLGQAAAQWDLGGEENKRTLRWASALHEIGHDISHSQHHKHGGYLLTHLDMPGFARGEQQRLACLVRGHRRKVPQVEFDKLPEPAATPIFRLCIILRLAVLLNRRRGEAQVPTISLKADDGILKMNFPEGWLDGHPLTTADLEQEETYLMAVDFKLKFK